jgi:predicted phosphodiesterase
MAASSLTEDRPFLQAEKLAISHGPYLINPGQNSMTIIWFTNKNSLSWLEYGTGDNFETFPKFGSLITVVANIRHGLVEANTTRHKIQIDGLKPGKIYKYRVVAKEILEFEPYEVLYGDSTASDIFEFRTPNPKKPEFTFYIFQDIHGDAARLDAMLQQVLWKDVDFVFFNGDTLSHIERESYIFEGFLDVAVNRFAKNIPFLYIRGNHDTRGAMAWRLEDYFPPHGDQFYYSFDRGPVHFIVLDSGEDKPDTSPVYAGLADFDRYRAQQAEWLKKEIKSEAFQQAPFRVAVFHMPPFGKGYGIEHLTKLWGPALNEGGVDLVISGHYHRPSRIDPTPNQNTVPILIGPADGMIRADVSKDRIQLKVTDVKGTVIDNLTVQAKAKKQ